MDVNGVSVPMRYKYLVFINHIIQVFELKLGNIIKLVDYIDITILQLSYRALGPFPLRLQFFLFLVGLQLGPLDQQFFLLLSFQVLLQRPDEHAFGQLDPTNFISH